MQKLNSDQLRKLLVKHTRKMNRLAEQNDLIVATLKQRGLKAIDPDDDEISVHPCVMQLDKLAYHAKTREMLEPKWREEMPLSPEELKSEDWWCADVSAECASALALMGLDVFAHDQWGLQVGSVFRFLSAVFLSKQNYVTRSLHSSFGNKRQIYRIGNNFYWGAPSDQKD